MYWLQLIGFLIQIGGFVFVVSNFKALFRKFAHTGQLIGLLYKIGSTICTNAVDMDNLCIDIYHIFDGQRLKVWLQVLKHGFMYVAVSVSSYIDNLSHFGSRHADVDHIFAKNNESFSNKMERRNHHGIIVYIWICIDFHKLSRFY